MNKNTLSISLFFVFAATMVAIGQPTEQGNFLVGTRVGFSTAVSRLKVESPTFNYDGEGARTSQFTISPNIGYFVTRNFAVGVGMSYSSYRSSNPSSFVLDSTGRNDDSYSSNLLFGPFARIYLPISEDNAFILGGIAGFGNTVNQVKVQDITQTIRTDLTSLGLAGGFTVFSQGGISLEALVIYSFDRSRNSLNLDGVQSKTTTWTNALNFSFGLQYYFGAGGGGAY